MTIEEENKQLHEQIEILKNNAMLDMKEITDLEIENKELKEEVKKRKMVADENGEHYDMMKDEYEKLEKENKKLKEELAECEKDKIKWELEAKGYKKTLDGISFSL